MNELALNEYELLKTDVDAIIDKAVFNSRMELIEGYWEVGQRIREYRKGEVTKLLQDLSLDLNKSERTLWYAVQFYDKFPELKMIETLEEGKNLSWNKIITKYLPNSRKEKEETYCRCPQCHYRGVQDEFKL